QTFREQSELSFDHIVVAVMWKFAAQTVAGLGRLSVPDTVRQNQIEAFDIQRLATPEELTGEFRAQKVAAVAGRAMEDQNGVTNQPVFIAARSTKSPVMDAEFRKD